SCRSRRPWRGTPCRSRRSRDWRGPGTYQRPVPGGTSGCAEYSIRPQAASARGAAPEARAADVSTAEGGGGRGGEGRRALAAMAAAWPAVVALRLLAGRDAGAVEDVYARGLFPPVERVLSALTGWVPFSVAEVLLVGGLLLAVVLAVRALLRWRRR